MNPTTILYLLAIITCFSFSNPKENLRPAITTLEPKKINHIDSMPVFKMTRTSIIASRKVMIPKPVITSDLSVTKFDAATTYIKGRGTMVVSWPRNLIPFKPIELGGEYTNHYKILTAPAIVWHLSFPEKKRFLFTFKLQVPSHKVLFLEIENPNQSSSTDFSSNTTDITYTVIMDFTDAPGDYLIKLNAGPSSTQWFFSSLLIQEIN